MTGWGREFVPVLIKESLSVGDGRVSGQHAKGGGLPCSVHPQQAKTLEETNVKLLIYLHMQQL